MRRDLTQLMGEEHTSQSITEGLTRMYDEGDIKDPTGISYSWLSLNGDFGYSLPCNVRDLAVSEGVYVKTRKSKPRRTA